MSNSNKNKLLTSSNSKNDKEKLKHSNDGKIGLIGAPTKFDLITRLSGSAIIPSNTILTQSEYYIITNSDEYIVWI